MVQYIEKTNKRELIKRGLIKVGTITPNDVLRKMYETIELLCGDVQNYNKDNLLYNFIPIKMLVFCLLCPLLLDFLALYSKKRSPLFGDALSLRHMTIYSLNIIDLAFYSLS